MPESVADMHVRYTADANGLVSETKKAGAAVQSMSQQMTSVLKALKGGAEFGWMSVAAHAAKSMSDGLLKFYDASEKGKSSVADLILEIGKGIPVAGALAQIGSDWLGALTNDKAGEAISKQATSTQEAFDKLMGSAATGSKSKQGQELEKLNAPYEAVRANIQQTIDAFNELSKSTLLPDGYEQTKAQVQKLSGELSQLDETQKRANADFLSAKQPIIDYNLSLQQQIDMVGMSADEQALYKLRLQGATDATLESTIAYQKELREKEKSFDATKKMREELQAYAVSVHSEVMTPTEKYTEAVKKLNDAFHAANTTMTPEDYARKLAALKKELADTDPIQQGIKKWTDATETPLEKYKKDMEELDKLHKAGMSDETYNRSVKKIKDDLYGTEKPKPFATTALQGSQEALAAVFAFKNQTDNSNSPTDIAKEQLKAQKTTNDWLDKMWAQREKYEMSEI